MPELDSCDCEGTIIKAGLAPGASWPECMTKYSFQARWYDHGRCDHPPDCPGTGKSVKRCRFAIQWVYEASCIGVGLVTYERAAESTDPWVDLGVDIVLDDGAGSQIHQPHCGRERRVELTYATEVIWEAEFRCAACTASLSGG